MWDGGPAAGRSLCSMWGCGDAEGELDGVATLSGVGNEDNPGVPPRSQRMALNGL